MKRRVGGVNYCIWVMVGWCFYPMKRPINGGRTGRDSFKGVRGCCSAHILFPVVEAGGGGRG